ncbi:MAG: uncharacterized protein KVP18_001131 [Porospora cf. gigantea A]|uniref:uncharacterized protein n=1 Tax=Porospora cf. gigantea A TaxID=2853593 RepID=UPI00355A1183|nr:MAG: hypothetical protein KVP18_001131 [Porospora cf. gigantea A]
MEKKRLRESAVQEVDGVKYGVDLLRYDGSRELEHAESMVIEGDLSWKDLVGALRVAVSVGKKLEYRQGDDAWSVRLD